MTDAVSPVYAGTYLPRVLGRHAKVSVGAIPIRPVEETTATLAPKRVTFYQRRPQWVGVQIVSQSTSPNPRGQHLDIRG